MSTASERRAARAAAKKKPDLPTEPVTEVAPQEAAPVRSRDVVTVGCKLPNGLILQNYELVDGFEPVFGGGSRPIKVAQLTGDPVKINGSSRAPNSDPELKRVIGGYGITPNVSKTFFDKWMRDNAALDIVKNGMIFANNDPARVADQARDFRSLRSGLESLNTEGRNADKSYIDPRMPRNIKKFNPEDESTDIRGA